MFDVIVIGSGPAGLFTAGRCGEAGLNVLLLEKNKGLGLKLLASGSGQCNLTNTISLDHFIKQFGEKERYVRKAIYTFSPNDLISFFENKNVKLSKMDNGKVFPEDRKAASILKVLNHYNHENKVKISVEEPVEKITKSNGYFKVETGKQVYTASQVMVACGGKSYPNLGTTGDGYGIAKSLGHCIVDPKPALAPIYNRSFELLELAGMTFKDIDLSLWRGQKKIKDFHGDLLITHKGLSGPVILDHSREFEEGDKLCINFVRFRSEADFKSGFEKSLLSHKRSSIKRMLDFYDVPRRLIDKILNLTNTKPELKCAELPKSNRKAIIKALIAFPFEINEVGDYNVAMATHGGVSTKEVNSKTYESRKVENLYFAGEVLDVDGNTGGFNIQFAFSSAYMASEAIIEKWRKLL